MGRDDLARLIQELADLSDSTARRRAQTVARWLCDLGLVEEEQGKLVYKTPASTTVVTHQRQAA